MFNFNFFDYLILAVIVLVFFWMIKNYFRNNFKNLRNKNGEFVDHNLKNDGASADTITESNNELSKKDFNGINRNTEHSAKTSNNKGKNSDKLPDIANETVMNQPGDGKNEK